MDEEVSPTAPRHVSETWVPVDGSRPTRRRPTHRRVFATGEGDGVRERGTVSQAGEVHGFDARQDVEEGDGRDTVGRVDRRSKVRVAEGVVPELSTVGPGAP